MSSNTRPVPADLRLIGFDVDGVFTDGRFYLSDDGVESKSFSTQDGYGIRKLIDAGIEVVVISGRQSVAVERRMAELGIKYVIQGSRDKVAALDNVAAELGVSVQQAAFVGDDVPDLALLQHVGYAFAVANAVPEVRAACNCVTEARGGQGAVREVCELVLQACGDAAT